MPRKHFYKDTSKNYVCTYCAVLENSVIKIVQWRWRNDQDDNVQAQWTVLPKDFEAYKELKNSICKGFSSSDASTSYGPSGTKLCWFQGYCEDL